jgi:hypothetical protein
MEAWHSSCQSQFDDDRERHSHRKGKAGGKWGWGVLQVEATTTVAITDLSQTDREADRRGFGRHSFCNVPERTPGDVEDDGTRWQGIKAGRK